MQPPVPVQIPIDDSGKQVLASLRKPLIQYLLMYLAVMCVFVPTFWYTFVWDDWDMIAQNESLREWKRLPDYFTDPNTFQNRAEFKMRNEYRPLRNVYYLFTYKMHDLHPTGWHFNHVLIHSLAAAMVLALFYRLYRFAMAWPRERQLPLPLQWAAWLTVFAWAIHPANTEVTAWIKSADDILAVIITTASLMILFPRSGRLTIKRAVLGAILFAPAFLAKESIAPIPLIYIVLVLVLAPDRRQAIRHLPHWVATAIMFAALAGYMVLRQAMLGQLQQVGYVAGNFSNMMATMTTALVRYLQLTFWPFWPTVQIGDYIDWPLYNSWTDPAVISSLCIIAATTVTIAILSRRSKVFLAGWLFAAIAFTPAANIIPMMQVMAERFMYFPLIGIALAMTAPLYALLRHDLRWLWLPGLICTALLITTHLRLPAWIDEQNFQRANIEAGPGSWRAEYNLAHVYYLQGDTTQALSLALSSIRRQKDEETALLISNILVKNGQLTSASAYLEKVKAAYPNSPRPYGIAGDTAVLRGETTTALENFERAAELDPDNLRVQYNIGILAHQLGSTTRALEAASHILSIDSRHTSGMILKQILQRETTAPE